MRHSFFRDTHEFLKIINDVKANGRLEIITTSSGYEGFTAKILSSEVQVFKKIFDDRNVPTQIENNQFGLNIHPIGGLSYDELNSLIKEFNLDLTIKL